MSTNNFKYKNILAVIPDFNFYHESEVCDCEDKDENGVCDRQGDYVDFDQWGYDSFIEEIQEELEKIGMYLYKDYKQETSYCRSYGGRKLADITFNFTNGDDYKTIEVVARNGYYQGQNIDYVILDNYNDGKTKILDKKIKVMCNKIERIIKKYCEEYKKVAQFSNGEAIYEKK